MHGFCSFIYNILLIFLSLFSLSVSILGCYKSTQLCPSQFASNPPNTVQPPLNHHHHNPSQLITTHDIPITKSTKNKGKSNPKSNLQRKTQQLRTQNQTFNKNPSTQTQVLESYGKGKDQQKKNWREKIMGDEVEIGCDFVIMWWGLKVSGKGNFFEAS